MALHRMLACNVILLIAAVAIGILCWPMMWGAQVVGPTPQPQGIPVTPEQAEQVEQENWAIHGQATNVWLLQPAFRSPYRGLQSLSPGANGRETVDVTALAVRSPVHLAAPIPDDELIFQRSQQSSRRARVDLRGRLDFSSNAFVRGIFAIDNGPGYAYLAWYSDQCPNARMEQQSNDGTSI